MNNHRINLCLLVIFLTLLSGNVVKAQQDTLQLKVWYITKFKTYEEQKRPQEEKTILEVGAVRRNFFSPIVNRKEFVVDSLTRAGVSRDEFLSEIYKYPSPKFVDRFFINFPKPGKLTSTHKSMTYYTYEEDIEQPQWRLLSDTLCIVGYPCMAAECDYRGRHWKAYYTLSIPVDAGPWKLSGLPGLILRAEDSTGDFSFECVGIQKGKGELLFTPTLKKHVSCTRQELMELTRRAKKDFVGYMKQYGLDATQSWDANGNPIKYKPQTALFLDN